MAITINIYYTGEKGNAKAFADEMVASGVVDEIKSEKGNLKYDYFVPFGNENTVLLIDSWESQEALEIHHHSQMMSKIIELREKYNLTMRVERYVSDENGVPDRDKKFIRGRSYERE